VNRTVAIDTETHLIQRPVAAPRMVCTTWATTGDEGGIATGPEMLALWHEWIRGTDRLVGHAFAFDTTVAMAFDPDLITPIFQAYEDERIEDTLLNFKLLDIAHGRLKFQKLMGGGYGLDACARRAGVFVDKADVWRLRYAELDGLPLDFWPEDAKQYARTDATATLAVWRYQQKIDAAWRAEHGSPILKDAPRRAQYDLALRLCSIWGVRTNATRVRELKAATERRMHELWKGGWTAAKTQKRHAPLTQSSATYTEKGKTCTGPLVRPSGSKNMKAAQALVEQSFQARGEPVPMTEPKENPKTGKTAEPRISTSRDTCILSGNVVLEDFAEYARTGTLIKRIADLEHGVTLPLQPRYDSLLDSGRTSSSKGASKKPLPRDLVGVQIQNFPRQPDEDLKRCMMELFGRVSDARATLEPRAGNVFILADYSAGELHTLAQACRDLFGFSKLGDMLNEGVDVHLWFGALAYGPPGGSYEEALARYKAGDPEVRAWRQSAKPITFGRPGGMGARRMVITARKSYGVRFTREEAQRLIALFDAAFPEIADLFAYVDGLMGGRSTCTFAHIRTGFWRGGCTYSAACNQQFQHLLAAGALPALFHVAMECYSTVESPLYGFRPVTFVHDEIVCEGPEARAASAVARLSEIMERELEKFTPDYPTKAEPVITRIWTKDAKTVRNAQGEVVLWQPKRAA